MAESKLSEMIESRISKHEKELERLVKARIEAAMPPEEPIRVKRHKSMQFPGRSQGHQTYFPGQGYGFPGQRYGSPGQEYGFPGQRYGFPGQGYGFPGQTSQRRNGQGQHGTRGNRYTYENYPAVLIRPEQVYFPNVTEMLGPIATARKIPACLSSRPGHEREVKLGSAAGLFRQDYDFV